MMKRPNQDTKTNLLTVSAIFALFATSVSPVVFEYSAVRWYVCGGLGATSLMLIVLRRQAVKAAATKTARSPSRRDTLRIRLISGIGLIVIGGVIVALFRTPGTDPKMFRFLVGFLITCLSLFASTFAGPFRRWREKENA